MKKVAIIGSAGIPPRYGGFETLAQNLVLGLKSKFRFVVYCSRKLYNVKERQTGNHDADLVYLPVSPNGPQSIIYDMMAIFHAMRNADIILIGVSRCGKTPTSLYLALKFGLFAANYPITSEDLSIVTLPKSLEPYKDKLFGLTITAQRLHEIRQQRKPNSTYASLPQCQKELSMVEKIFKRADISHLNSTTFSIEEIATKIMAMKQIKRQRF